MIPQVDLLRITIDQQVSGQDSLLVSVFNLHKPGNHTQEGSASNVAPEPLRAKDSMLQAGWTCDQGLIMIRIRSSQFRHKNNAVGTEVTYN